LPGEWGQLPSEIIAEILLIVKDGTSGRSWIQMLGLCSNWRRTGYHCRPLWEPFVSRHDFDDDGNVVVAFPMGKLVFDKFDPLLSFCAANAHRLRTLQLDGGAMAMAAFLNKLPVLPVLEKLEITAISSREDEQRGQLYHRQAASGELNAHSISQLSPGTSGPSFPTLRSARIHGALLFFPATLPATLEELHINGRAISSNPPEWTNAHPAPFNTHAHEPQLLSPDGAYQLLSHLAHLRELRKLDLLDCLPELHTLAPIYPISSLPNLEFLNLRAPISATHQLLRHIHISPYAMVCLSMPICNIAAIPLLLDELGPMHARDITGVDIDLQGPGPAPRGQRNGPPAHLALTAQRADGRAALSLHALIHTPCNPSAPLERLARALVTSGSGHADDSAVRTVRVADTLGAPDAQRWLRMFGTARNVRAVAARGAAATALVGALQTPWLFPGVRALELHGADFAVELERAGAGGAEPASDVLTRVLVERREVADLVIGSLSAVGPVETDMWKHIVGHHRQGQLLQ
jgi:hypothetical protein